MFTKNALERVLNWCNFALVTAFYRYFTNIFDLKYIAKQWKHKASVLLERQTAVCFMVSCFQISI